MEARNDPAGSRGHSAEALGDIGKALRDIAKMLAGTVERLVVIVQTFPGIAGCMYDIGERLRMFDESSPHIGRKLCEIGRASAYS